MIFPFYHNDSKAYTIDDANYDCGRIIVADCNNGHKYATLCELVADCPEMKQLTRPCIVDALNNLSTLPNTNSLNPQKWFLRVTTDGCLEVADPCICNDGDRYVAATPDDNAPGTLDQKVRGSCSTDGLYCIDIEEAGPQTLVWRPSGPHGPFINPSMPTTECENGSFYVKLKKGNSGDWAVDYDCEQANKPHHAKCVFLAQNGFAHDSCQNRTVRYVVPWASSEHKPVAGEGDDTNSYIEGDWSVRGTEAFRKPKGNGFIRITTPGIYEVSFSTYITFGQVLHSIRCGIYADEGDGMHEINDIKYQCGEYWSDRTDDGGRPHNHNVTINRLWPDEWDEEKFKRNASYSGGWGVGWTLDNTGLPFARSYQINVKDEVELFLVIKPDMRGVDPRLIIDNDNLDRYLIKVSGVEDLSNPYGASTTVEITRLSDAILEDRLKPLKD